MNVAGHPRASSQEEGVNFTDLVSSRAHLLLQGVYEYHLHQNNGLHIYIVVADNAVWQLHWRWLDMKLESWYATLQVAVGYRFTSILAAECLGVLDWGWNS